MELDGTERRVLGVLIEKALAYPDYYPLTVNALVAGANQRSNRDPIMAVGDGEAVEALENLRAKGLTSILVREGGRASRWSHNLDTAWSLNEKEQAVLAELLLRGPQTEGELRARASRMRPIESIGELGGILEGLAGREEPLVARTEREPGRRGIRFRHCLYTEGEEPQVAAAGTGGGRGVDAGAAADMLKRLEAVEEAVQTLTDEVSRIRSDLDALR
jgi:uncharacterized protein YceH (UPF0502 family)